MLSADTISRASVNRGGPDPISPLPEPAAAKLRRLRQRQTELAVLGQHLAERQHAAALRKIEAASALERQRRAPVPRRYFGEPVTFVGGHRDNGGAMTGLHYAPGNNSAAALAAAETELLAASVALADIAEQIASISARRSALPRLLTDWLRTIQPEARIKLHDEPIKSLKGDPLAAVEAARARIA